MAARAGDWPCPNAQCINSFKMVFQKYSTCPKCGSPPASMMNNIVSRSDLFRSGDWQCPNQGCVNNVKMVFATKSECPKCGTPKPSGDGSGGGAYGGGYDGGCGYPSPRPAAVRTVPVMQSVPQFKPAPQITNGNYASGGADNAREDDWQCSNVDCINHTKLVFGKHSACPSCGASKNAERAGDWQCPNVQCPNHRNSVFAKHVVCPKCHAPRPQRGRVGSSMPMLMPMAPMARLMPTPSMSYGPPPMRFPGGGPAGGNGDWQCPNMECLNHIKLVFGKHDECPKCGALKGAGNPRDWQCPNQDCMNHTKLVFAKHEQCPKCGEARPEDGSRARSRSPHGI